MPIHFDAPETRAPANREAALMAALPGHVDHARRCSAAYAEVLAHVDAAALNSRQALAQLPVVRKYQLLERQQASRAVGWGLR